MYNNNKHKSKAKEYRDIIMTTSFLKINVLKKGC